MENTTTSIASGEVSIDSLIEALTSIQQSAQTQIENFASPDNPQFATLVSRSCETMAKNTAERVVLRNSVKRDIARRLAEELVLNTSFMDELGRQIIQIHSQQQSQGEI